MFDSVGRDTFEGSLKSLRRRGVLVGCGTASGPFPPIDAMQMVLQGSVYFTRPAFADYYADPAERAELAAVVVRSSRPPGGSRSRSASAMRSRTASRRTAISRPGKSIGSSVFVL